MLWNLLVGLRCYVWAGLHESLQPCSRAARKWRENEEMRRKWRENEEMERDWLSTFPHSLSISSLFLHFLPLFPFPTSKCITFCCKMLNTALLSRMSQKSQHTRYEEIILGRTCCEEAPQFVPAWVGYHLISLQYTSGMFFVLRPLRKPNDKVLKLFFSCKVHPVTKMITFTTNFKQKRSRWRQTWNTAEISTILTTRHHFTF